MCQCAPRRRLAVAPKAAPNMNFGHFGLGIAGTRFGALDTLLSQSIWFRHFGGTGFFAAPELTDLCHTLSVST